MKRPLLLGLLGALVLPGTALAAPVKISPKAVTVADDGVALVEVANSSSHAFRGTAAVTAGSRKIVSRKLRLPRLSVSDVKLRFNSSAVSALRSAGSRGTVKLSLRRAGGRRWSGKRRLAFRLPGGGPPAPASNRWLARMGGEGAYDDFEFTLDGGQMTLTKPAFVPVYCFENGGTFRKGLSFELFDVPGPWTIGTDGSQAKSAPSVNSIVTGGARSITYKVTNTAAQAGSVTGTLGMSFFDSQYDIFSNTITFVNCSGAQSFDAVPAG
jgi:hypothetical protein